MSDITQSGTIESSLNEGVRMITFSHPSHNSMPTPLLRKLKEAIVYAGRDEATKVIILKSGGDRTFCAGASFDELVSIENEKQGEAFFMGFANVINAMRSCPKIIIGRVQGKAVGGGVGLAAATDYCLASKYGAVKLSELSIGIGPFVISPVVERRIGTTAFSHLALDAMNWQTARWAMDKGLYAAIYEDNNALDKAVQELAAQLAKSNPNALFKMKKILWKGTEDWGELLHQRAIISGQLVLSDFTKKALIKS